MNQQQLSQFPRSPSSQMQLGGQNQKNNVMLPNAQYQADHPTPNFISPREDAQGIYQQHQPQQYNPQQSLPVHKLQQIAQKKQLVNNNANNTKAIPISNNMQSPTQGQQQQQHGLKRPELLADSYFQRIKQFNDTRAAGSSQKIPTNNQNNVNVSSHQYELNNKASNASDNTSNLPGLNGNNVNDNPLSFGTTTTTNTQNQQYQADNIAQIKGDVVQEALAVLRSRQSVGRSITELPTKPTAAAQTIQVDLSMFLSGNQQQQQQQQQQQYSSGSLQVPLKEQSKPDSASTSTNNKNPQEISQKPIPYQHTSSKSLGRNNFNKTTGFSFIKPTNTGATTALPQYLHPKSPSRQPKSSSSLLRGNSYTQGRAEIRKTSNSPQNKNNNKTYDSIKEKQHIRSQTTQDNNTLIPSNNQQQQQQEEQQQQQWLKANNAVRSSKEEFELQERRVSNSNTSAPNPLQLSPSAYETTKKVEAERREITANYFRRESDANDKTITTTATTSKNQQYASYRVPVSSAQTLPDSSAKKNYIGVNSSSSSSNGFGGVAYQDKLNDELTASPMNRDTEKQQQYKQIISLPSDSSHLALVNNTPITTVSGQSAAAALTAASPYIPQSQYHQSYLQPSGIASNSQPSSSSYLSPSNIPGLSYQSQIPPSQIQQPPQPYQLLRQSIPQQQQLQQYKQHMNVLTAQLSQNNPNTMQPRLKDTNNSWNLPTSQLSPATAAAATGASRYSSDHQHNKHSSDKSEQRKAIQPENDEDSIILLPDDSLNEGDTKEKEDPLEKIHQLPYSLSPHSMSAKKKQTTLGNNINESPNNAYSNNPNEISNFQIKADYYAQNAYQNYQQQISPEKQNSISQKANNNNNNHSFTLNQHQSSGNTSYLQNLEQSQQQQQVYNHQNYPTTTTTTNNNISNIQRYLYNTNPSFTNPTAQSNLPINALHRKNIVPSENAISSISVLSTPQLLDAAEHAYSPSNYYFQRGEIAGKMQSSGVSSPSASLNYFQNQGIPVLQTPPKQRQQHGQERIGVVLNNRPLNDTPITHNHGQQQQKGGQNIEQKQYDSLYQYQKEKLTPDQYLIKQQQQQLLGQQDPTAVGGFDSEMNAVSNGYSHGHYRKTSQQLADAIDKLKDNNQMSSNSKQQQQITAGRVISTQTAAGKRSSQSPVARSQAYRSSYGYHKSDGKQSKKQMTEPHQQLHHQYDDIHYDQMILDNSKNLDNNDEMPVFVATDNHNFPHSFSQQPNNDFHHTNSNYLTKTEASSIQKINPTNGNIIKNTIATTTNPSESVFNNHNNSRLLLSIPSSTMHNHNPSDILGAQLYQTKEQRVELETQVKLMENRVRRLEREDNELERKRQKSAKEEEDRKKLRLWIEEENKRKAENKINVRNQTAQNRERMNQERNQMKIRKEQHHVERIQKNLSIAKEVKEITRSKREISEGARGGDRAKTSYSIEIIKTQQQRNTSRKRQQNEQVMQESIVAQQKKIEKEQIKAMQLSQRITELSDIQAQAENVISNKQKQQFSQCQTPSSSSMLKLKSRSSTSIQCKLP